MKKIEEIMEQQRAERIELFTKLFSDRLKELREEKKMSQKTVANKLGCAISTYANWEQGRREPSIYDIYNLMWVYGIEAGELFDIEHLI